MHATPRWRRALAGVALVLAAWPAAAGATALEDPVRQWLPSADGASWTYAWSNSTYAPTPRRETYTVTGRDGEGFTINWAETGLPAYETPTAGAMNFRHTDAGLVSTSYQSTPAPPQFPLLCASATRCGNSLAGSLFMVIWGTRSSVLPEPLVQGTQWSATGGADNDVASRNRYARVERVVVPAFPGGVDAVKVVSDVTQTGAIGDPFGTGTRTVWWVYGIGPVKVLLQHAGGDTSLAALQSTTLKERAMPSQINALPLADGASATFRWRNSRRMPSWSRQRFTTIGVLNNTARIEVEDLAGPIDVDASYVLSSRLSGTRLLNSTLRRGRVPSGLRRHLAPKGGKGWHRRFVTPYDLLTYGFSPVLPAYPRKGMAWRSSIDSRDWRTYHVLGDSKVLGRRTVKTPAGKFRAVVVRSRLRQPGVPYGSGVRTAWLAPGTGLVKLVFRHGDGSVSRVERLR